MIAAKFKGGPSINAPSNSQDLVQAIATSWELLNKANFAVSVREAPKGEAGVIGGNGGERGITVGLRNTGKGADYGDSPCGTTTREG